MRSLNHLLVNIVVLLASLVVGLLLLEIGARAIGGAPLFSTTNWVAQALEAGTENLTSVYDETLGWRARPDMRRIGDSANHPDAPDFSHVTVTTNGLSLRMNSAETPVRETPPKGAWLALGDSFTWGSEVSDNETYPAHLERIVGRPVLNAAYGGWGVGQMYLRAETLMPVLQSDVLLLSPLSDDHLRNGYRRYGRAFKPYFGLTADGGLDLRNVPVPRNSAEARDVGVWQAVFGYSYLIFWGAQALGLQEVWVNRNLLYDQVHDFEESVEISCRLFPRFQALAAAHEARLLFVQVYSGPEVLKGERHWYSQQALDCARTHGLEVVDTYDAFRVVAEDGGEEALKPYYSIWRDGRFGHMSSRGNQLVAETIAHYQDRVAEATLSGGATAD